MAVRCRARSPTPHRRYYRIPRFYYVRMIYNNKLVQLKHTVQVQRTLKFRAVTSEERSAMEVWRAVTGESLACQTRALDADCGLGTPCRDRGGICETRVSTQRSHPRKGYLLRRLHEEVAATVHPVPNPSCLYALPEALDLPWPDSESPLARFIYCFPRPFSLSTCAAWLLPHRHARRPR